MDERIAVCKRRTNETDISVKLNIDGQGRTDIDTGIGFFDHMLECFARHGLFDLEISAKGDLRVDCHHTVEDTGIVLGEAIRKALGDKKGIARYGSFLVPMDETLALCAIDLSGRAYLNYDAHFTVERIESFDTEMFHEFFYAVAVNACMNLHLKILDPGNNHHMGEALFKAFARALDTATQKDARVNGIWSTKGSL